VFEQGRPRTAITHCEKILDLPEARCSLLKVIYAVIIAMYVKSLIMWSLERNWFACCTPGL
jgi:hypothetical protein